MKKTFALSLLIFTFHSCSKQDKDESTLITESQETKNILSFDSSEEIENKINFIIALKNEKETVVVDEMFNSKESSVVEISEENKLTDELINSVKEYHEKELENIYSLREELAFTSIQSIVDEINSLKLINPSKAKKLLTEHGQYINQGIFLVQSKMSSRISEVLNLEGKLLLENNLVDYSENVQSANSVGKNQLFGIQSGILAINSFYAITWYAGFHYAYVYGAHQHTPYTQLSSLINIGGGYFAWPSKMNVNGYADFSVPFDNGRNRVRFAGTGGSYQKSVVLLGLRYNSLSPFNGYRVKGVEMTPGSFSTFTAIPWINPYLNLTSGAIDKSF